MTVKYTAAWKSNFAFLQNDFPVLANFGRLAENYCYSDANSCLMKLGMIGETIVNLIFTYDRLQMPGDNSAVNRIAVLMREGLVTPDLVDILHALRKTRNKAVHENYASVEDCKTFLPMTHSLCEWFMQTYGNWNYEHEDFRLPMESAEGPVSNRQKEEKQEAKLLDKAEKTAAAAPAVEAETRKKQANYAAGRRQKSEAETRYMIDEQLRKVGWEAATLVGIVACTLFPVAVYWRGPMAYPLIGFLVVVTVLCWYLVGAGGPDPRVLEGSGATLLGVAWIGGLGSSAAAILGLHDGTPLLVTAILATVAYDVAGLFVGRSMGHRPLTTASPNKTIEGLVGGMGAAFVMTLIVVGIVGKGPWTGFGPALLLGVGAACAAPLGDLCQSLLKRDLGVKDMGTILPGHGGVLDRFDSMLFVLPTVFWLAVAVGHLV